MFAIIGGRPDAYRGLPDIAHQSISDGGLFFTFDIEPENLCAEYNGQVSVAATVLSKTANTAKVAMSVGLSDAADGNAGDVTKAFVEFNYNGSWVTVPVQALNPAKTIGNASLVATINFSGDASTLSFAYRISGYYQMDAECSDNGQTVVNIYKPQGEFITGGGHVKATIKSVGIIPADSGRKANFGFNVKYNQKNTNLQGNINYVFRRKENGIIRLYQVKGNSMTSLTVNLKDAAEGGTKTAVFTGKCNVTDVTDPLLPTPVPGTGNSIMQVIITDAGEPGTSDKYGITVWNSTSQLLHSSNWESTKTTKLLLNAGNVVVSGATTAASATPTREPDPAKIEDQVAVSGLTVRVLNNPSLAEFTLIVRGNNEQPITMRVTDLNGRLIDLNNKISNGQSVRLGYTYRKGVYLAEFSQGGHRKVVKLMKM